MENPIQRRHIEIQGAVQGVGFRPFVYRTAQVTGVHGYVLNCSDGVVIEAEGDGTAISRFLSTLRDELPPLARIDEMKIAPATPSGERGFAIRESLAADGKAAAGNFAFVPPDAATCPDCLRELTTPGDRRYHYPFINCTNCGPRYTIIRDIPYDRARTTMAQFRMCPACQAEYEDPANRRFHAEPNACPDCGPALALLSAEELAAGAVPVYGAGSLKETRRLLQQGAILAIKGLGGFHLACAAADDGAVTLLRERKRRSGKAFAIMVKDLAVAERLCEVTAADSTLLQSARRPIVLMRRRPSANVSSNAAPGNDSLGVLLPYTPLHHLLFEKSPGYDALVMTSGNLSEEPIVSRNEDAWPRLKGLADYFLLHNRDIQTRVDDSVVRTLDARTFEGREYPVRRSRGFAPDPIDLGMPVREILAVGGELKNTLCLTKDRYAILSPHIGDLENIETMEFFREALAHLKRFFRVAPEAAAHDLHPNYLSTRFALEESGLPTIGVQHHHAHIASCMADNGLGGRVIGVALDGTGYGTDGKIWGGEFLACDYAQFERRGHLRYVPLAGGDTAIRQPWRSALAYLRDAFGPEAAGLPLPLFREVPPREIRFVETMLTRKIQTVETSSCGRLFDAVASILGVRHQTTYEGQAAIELEAVASSALGTYPFNLAGDVTFQADLRPSIEAIAKEYVSGTPVPEISARFHRTMACVVRDACLRIRELDGLTRVCLSGGTFQNLRLLRHTVDELRARQFDVFVHRRVPSNDGGLSLGQAAAANSIILDQRP